MWFVWYFLEIRWIVVGLGVADLCLWTISTCDYSPLFQILRYNFIQYLFCYGPLGGSHQTAIVLVLNKSARLGTCQHKKSDIQ